TQNGNMQHRTTPPGRSFLYESLASLGYRFGGRNTTPPGRSTRERASSPLDLMQTINSPPTPLGFSRIDLFNFNPGAKLLVVALICSKLHPLLWDRYGFSRLSHQFKMHGNCFGNALASSFDTLFGGDAA